MPLLLATVGVDVSKKVIELFLRYEDRLLHGASTDVVFVLHFASFPLSAEARRTQKKPECTESNSFYKMGAEN